MSSARPDRDLVLAVLRDALAPIEGVLAIWEGGSASWSLDDEHSDVDVGVLADDGSGIALRVLDVVEETLGRVSRVALRWRVAEPLWRGVEQCFYQLAPRAEPSARRDVITKVDVAVIARSAPSYFLEPEQHGHARVVFDPHGLTVPKPFDAGAFRARMKADLADALDRFRMLDHLVEKELDRGKVIDAHAFFLSVTVRALVIVLGMKHRPLRYGFGMRYLHRDLPPDVVATIESLLVPAVPDAIRDAHTRGRALIESTATALDLDALDLDALSREVRERRGRGLSSSRSRT